MDNIIDINFYVTRSTKLNIEGLYNYLNMSYPTDSYEKVEKIIWNLDIEKVLQDLLIIESYATLPDIEWDNIREALFKYAKEA